MVHLETDNHPNPKVQRFGRLLRHCYVAITVFAVQFLALGVIAMVINYQPFKYGMVVFGFIATVELASIMIGYMALKRMRPVYWFVSFAIHALWIFLVSIAIIILTTTELDDSFPSELCLHIAFALWYPFGWCMLYIQWRLIQQLGIWKDGGLNLKSASN